jgi:hypothetical protein
MRMVKVWPRDHIVHDQGVMTAPSTPEMHPVDDSPRIPEAPALRSSSFFHIETEDDDKHLRLPILDQHPRSKSFFPIMISSALCNRRQTSTLTSEELTPSSPATCNPPQLLEDSFYLSEDEESASSEMLFLGLEESGNDHPLPDSTFHCPLPTMETMYPDDAEKSACYQLRLRPRTMPRDWWFENSEAFLQMR